MADTLKFGPKWLRDLSDGNTVTSPPSSPGLKKIKIAEFRYGREEMLALYEHSHCQRPEKLTEFFPDIALEKSQQPLAFFPLNDEEQRCWSKSVNSDIVLRLNNRGTTNGSVLSRSGGTGVTRGGSVDRGRGRGRNSFYSRNLDDVNSSDLKDSLVRPGRSSFDRSLSLTDRNQSWDDKDRKFSKDFSIRGTDENGLSSTRKEFRPPDNWRSDRDDGEEDSGWRSSKSKGDKWHRPTWRSHETRPTDFNQNIRHETRPFKNRFSDEIVDRDQLPEWSKDDDFECVGTFDSSGAFRENQHRGRKFEDSCDNRNDPVKPKEKTSKLSETRNGNSEEIPVKESSPVNNTQNSRSQNLSTNDEQWDKEGAKDDDVVSSSSSSLSSNSSSGESNKLTNHQPFFNSKQNVIKNSDLLVPKTDSSVIHNVNQQQETNNSSETLNRSEPVFDHLKDVETLMANYDAEDEAKSSSINNLVQPAQTPLERIPSVPPHHENAFKWLYRDPQGKIQGPFTSGEMSEWFNAGYFSMNLLVRRCCDENFIQLGELMKLWGRCPFSGGQNPPPIKTNPVKEPHLSENSPMKSPQEDEMRMHQQNPHIYQYMQQKMIQDTLLRQKAQAMSQQNPSLPEGFNLTQQQHQQLLWQLMFSGSLPQSMPPPPVIDNSPTNENMQQYLSKIAASHPPAGLWPNMPRPGPSVWDIDSRSQSEPVQQHTAAIISTIEEIQQRREKEEKAKQQRELEERRLAEAESLLKAEEKRLELQRQEEVQRKQELIRQEEERRKKEELQRQEEERQHLEELRLQKVKEDEERKRKENEHRRQLEELRKQEQLRKEEERRKQEEQQVQERMLQIEEIRRLELQRIAEEKKKEKELERLKEIERKKAIEKQIEYERELEENRRKIQEMKNRQQTSPWGSTNASSVAAAPSLAEIQKLQEEREQRERIEKQKQLMQQQQQQIAMLQQQQQMRNSLTWANNTQVKGQETQIKSLAEIQREEEERVSKQQLEQAKQNKSATNNLTLNAAGVWGNASNQLNWSAAENHLKSDSFSAGFWDEPKKKSPSAKKSVDPAYPVLVNQSKAQKKSTNQSNKTKSRSKKEEENVLKLFKSQTSSLDDLTKWCYEALTNLDNAVHVPTFIGFLKDIESPYEVEDYVKSFLGESKELKDFTKQYLERRSKQRNQVNNTKHEENMWGPAPAIMPNQNKVSNHDENGKNNSAKKKKKGKMQKLDSSVLGFTVHADPTRINVGEIDHGDSSAALK